MRSAMPGLLVALLLPGAAAAQPHVAEFGMPVRTTAMARTAALCDRVTTAVLRPGRRFDLVGLRWSGRGTLDGARLRTRIGGRWHPWVPLAGAGDHGPDRGAPTRGSDPVWAGGADALQLSWRHAPAGLRLRFVRVTHRARIPARATAAQAPAPPAIVPRSAWDPDNSCKPRAAPSYGHVDMAFVHHTVSDNAYSPDASAAIVLAICRYHRDSNGWNDIGYNFLVDRYGRLFEGRAGGIDQPVVGAQAQGWNSQSTSVSNIGTFEDVPETDAAMSAMADLLAWKLGLHGVPVTGTVTLTSGGGTENRYPSGAQVTFQRISGHRDGGKTACPGQALYDQLPALRNLTAARAGASTGTPAPSGTVTLRALSTALRYPEPARLTGSLAGGGEVWVQVASGSAYRTVARAQPAPDGTWAAEIPVTRGYVFRALQVMPDGSHGATSPPVRVALRPGLDASAPRRVLAGRAATVRGAIAPQQGLVTASSWIQGRGGRFHFVGRAVVRPSRGRFAVRLRLGRPGLYRLRLRFAGSRFALPATAPDVYVRAVRDRRSLSGGTAAPQG